MFKSETKKIFCLKAGRRRTKKKAGGRVLIVLSD